MPSILTKPLDLFTRNPVFLASLRIPWETSTQADKDPLIIQHEVNRVLQDIATLSQLYQHNHIDHLPKVAPFIRLASIASPIFRENIELLALERLWVIRKLLPVHVQVSRIIQTAIINLYKQEKLSNAKVHSLIKENGDFETIILADPPDRGPYFFTKLLYKKIKGYLGSRHRRRKLDCPGITLQYLEEENEERGFIEMEIENSKIIIRDLSSQCYLKHFSPKDPFSVQDEPSSFRARLLTAQLLSLMKKKSLLPQREKEFPMDIYPFIVRDFLRIEKPSRLLDLSGLQYSQQIDEEHLLWNEFLSFCQKPENLFKILYEAQKVLRGFGDYDCIQTDVDGNHSIYKGSKYAETCKRLVDILHRAFGSEGLGEENCFFLEKAAQ